MVAVRSITLLAMLAAAVTSTRTDFKKRVSTTETVVFRSDLKEGEGQSDKFKNLIRTFHQPFQ